MKWIETTLRKGKQPKVCRDMFITNSFGTLQLCKVKNGKIFYKMVIDDFDFKRHVKEHNLIFTRNVIFNNCGTWRTCKSTKLVNKLMADNK